MITVKFWHDASQPMLAMFCCFFSVCNYQLVW